MLAESAFGNSVSFATLVLGLVAFILGLNQYRKAQQWKKAEFVAAEMEKFFANPQVQTALLLLDYTRVKIDSEGKRAIGDKEGDIYDDAAVTSALRLHTDFRDDNEAFSPKEMVARLAFDELLTQLEAFQHFVTADVISSTDVVPYLNYWLNAMSNPESKWKDHAFYVALARFIQTYGYAGAKRLIDNYQMQALGKSVMPWDRELVATPERERSGN